MSRAVLALLALVAAPAVAAEPDSAPRAAGGRAFLEAAVGAPVVVLGRIGDWRQLDLRGFGAALTVRESILGAAVHGQVLEMVWEELATGRAPRFARGELVLVALEPLAVNTLWRRRLPDPKRRAQTLQVAAHGEAFVRQPSPGSIEAVRHYLELAPEDRRRPEGAGHLCELAAEAQPALAVAAVVRLRDCEDLDEAGGASLVRALLREDANEELRELLLDLFAARRFEALRAPLVALSRREPPSPLVFEALGRLDGGLPPEQTLRLLTAGSTQERVVAARFAVGPGAPEQLERLLDRDPEPEVRAAAVERFVEIAGPAALEPAAGALADPDPQVRAAAARGLGSLGAGAVPRLREVAEGDSFEAAQAAGLGLRLTHVREGHDALIAIASSHSDRRIRDLAGLALGRALPAH